jgi:hypothetical protein
MAFGGAGIFLSLPLLKQLQPHLDNCSPRYHDYYKTHEVMDEMMGKNIPNGMTGDRALALCIYEHTLTKFTPSPDLHQLDLHGDLSGFYESGRAFPMSLHHWKSWHAVPMLPLVAVGSVCGDECPLMRWRLANGWWITNGYSLVRYSEDYEKDRIDDIRMERTWQDEWGEYQHSLEPLRDRDWAKTSMRLVGALPDEGSGGKVVRQWYAMEDEEANWVFELVWRRN